MPRHDIAIKLRHMRDAAREAQQFDQDRTRAELSRDRMLALALTRLLEIIGEAAKSVSSEIGEAYPEVPRKALSGMRDRLAHRYFDVDLDIVWSVVTRDLPILLPQIEAILAEQASEA
jgi:uncharacterized protein with HEPN domain